MIPRTFPSSKASNGATQMIVYFLPSVSGLTRWVDYIPVKFTTVATAATENTYNQNGYIPVTSLSSITGLTPFKEYVPVFLDSNAVDADVWDVNITGFIPVGTAGIGGAALYLDFAATTTLDPRVTFSRTTNATLTNSAGLVTYAPTNLLTYSEQFDNAVWQKIAAGTGAVPVVTANLGVAPDGTTTADRIVFDRGVGTTSADISYVNYAVTSFTGTATASIWLKTTDGSTKVMSFRCGAPGSQQITVTGTWQRFVITQTNATIDRVQMLLYGNDGAQTVSVYAWGAQLETSSTASTYNSTTVKNLLGYTENFDNAAWTKSNASITSGFTDIYGQPFAQSITATLANATVLSSYTAVASTPYTFSVYLQRVSGTGNVDISVDGTTWVTQTLTTTLQRFTVTGTLTAGAKTPGIRVVSSGDVVIAFGAQLSDSASVDPYVYQPVAAPTSTAYYGPRFDYDPVTLQPKGLLIEEQRTNLVLNSSILNTQIVTVTAAAHTLSFYGTGTIVLSGAYTGTLVGTGAYPTRTTLTFTPIVGALTLTVTGSVTMAQLEAGAFATSYIPTGASQVTRAADNASMIGNNFARWYNASAGSLFAQFDVAAVASGSPGMAIVSADNGAANGYVLYKGTASAVMTAYAGVNNAAIGSVGVNTSAKGVVAYDGINNAGALNGAAPVAITAAAVPTPTQLLIGRSFGGNTLSGHVSRIAYYNRRLSNTELQGITA